MQCRKGKRNSDHGYFRYLTCLIFSDRSMYMHRKTGTFEGSFSKNTVYRFLNSTKINWQRVTALLSSEIINGSWSHWQLRSVRMSSLLMTACLTGPVQRRRNFWQESLTIAPWSTNADTVCLSLDGRTETPSSRWTIASSLLQTIKTFSVRQPIMMDVPWLGSSGGSPQESDGCHAWTDPVCTDGGNYRKICIVW